MTRISRVIPAFGDKFFSHVKTDKTQERRKCRHMMKMMESVSTVDRTGVRIGGHVLLELNSHVKASALSSARLFDSHSSNLRASSLSHQRLSTCSPLRIICAFAGTLAQNAYSGSSTMASPHRRVPVTSRVAILLTDSRFTRALSAIPVSSSVSRMAASSGPSSSSPPPAMPCHTPESARLRSRYSVSSLATLRRNTRT